MFLCNQCDEPYQSYGDCSGICEDCRDERELRQMLDAMTEDQYREFMRARQANIVFHSIKNWKLAS